MIPMDHSRAAPPRRVHETAPGASALALDAAGADILTLVFPAWKATTFLLGAQWSGDLYAFDGDRRDQHLNGRRCLTPRWPVIASAAGPPEPSRRQKTLSYLYDAVHSPIASEVQRLEVYGPSLI